MNLNFNINLTNSGGGGLYLNILQKTANNIRLLNFLFTSDKKEVLCLG